MALCVPPQRAELLDWIQRFDHDRSSTLNFREFADMMMEWKQQELRGAKLFRVKASGWSYRRSQVLGAG